MIECQIKLLEKNGKEKLIFQNLVEIEDFAIKREDEEYNLAFTYKTKNESYLKMVNIGQ